MKRMTLMLAALTLLFGSLGQAEAGPIDPLYLTDGDSGHLFIVQGNSLTTINTSPYGQVQYAITVGDTVRISSAIKSQGYNQGAEYTLAGTYTGVNYTNNYGSQLLDWTSPRMVDTQLRVYNHPGRSSNGSNATYLHP